MYSNGKTASCIVVGILVGRGLLNYGERVSIYWPEFGCNGKEDILLEGHRGTLVFGDQMGLHLNYLNYTRQDLAVEESVSLFSQ